MQFYTIYDIVKGKKEAEQRKTIMHRANAPLGSFLFADANHRYADLSPQTIDLPVTLYDMDGNEYTSLSGETNGKTLTNTLPSAGFDGLELVATTSVGVVALLAVGYAIISTKKRKETKFDV